MSLAEERKAIEQQKVEIERQATVQRETLQHHAQLMTIEDQLKQFEQLDWQKVIDDDPVQALKLQHQYQTLQGMRQQAASKIEQAQQEAFTKQQRHVATLIQEGQAALAKEIKGWSPELAGKLQEYGQKSLGYSQQELSNVYDPRAVKMMHKAYLYDQLIAKQTKQPAEPPAPVTTIKAQKATAVKNPDNMSADEWLKWRNSQLKRKA
jgi:hypothetical protein